MTDKELGKEVELYLEDKFCENVCTCDEAEECKRGIRIRCMSFDLKKTLIINFVEPREKKIIGLEKENKDLRLTLELERKNKTNVFAELNDETARSNSMLMEELAEAKDIIEDLITKIPASLVAHFESEKERAEKFLGWK